MTSPSKVQKRGEASSYAAVAELLEHGNPVALTDSTGAKAELPADTVELLRSAIAAMIQGHTPQVVSMDQTLSTQEAAQLLGISRPTLVRLLEDGAIDYVQPAGVHRRVSLSAISEYRTRIAEGRREILSEMTAEAAMDDSYEEANGFIQTR